ncbi:MAG: hypothetical protein U0531_06460 [Dehalococcoidia bacterium]
MGLLGARVNLVRLGSRRAERVEPAVLDNVPALVDVLTALVKQEGDCTPDVADEGAACASSSRRPHAGWMRASRR